MINLNDCLWTKPGIKQDRIDRGLQGESLCIIIDSVVVHILPIDKDLSDKIKNAEFSDGGIIGDQFCVNLIFDNGIDQLLCDEKTYAVLLSEPIFSPILESHRYKEMVSEGWSFINGEFVIPGEME